jgi:hypothetical protein
MAISPALRFGELMNAQRQVSAVVPKLDCGRSSIWHERNLITASAF